MMLLEPSEKLLDAARSVTDLMPVPVSGGQFGEQADVEMSLGDVDSQAGFGVMEWSAGYNHGRDMEVEDGV
jgi:hypothetical protein